MKELLKQLNKVKEEIKPIVKSETNPFFKSKYFDINALLLQIEPILHKHGLILVQPIEDNSVSSKIYHVESGEVLESKMTLPELNDPQKMGSAVTYYRRYTLQSLLALQAEDDDGNHASEKVNKPVLRNGSNEWKQAQEYLQNQGGTIEAIKKKYVISPSDEAILKNG